MTTNAITVTDDRTDAVARVTPAHIRTIDALACYEWCRIAPVGAGDIETRLFWPHGRPKVVDLELTPNAARQMEAVAIPVPSSSMGAQDVFCVSAFRQVAHALQALAHDKPLDPKKLNEIEKLRSDQAWAVRANGIVVHRDIREPAPGGKAPVPMSLGHAFLCAQTVIEALKSDNPKGHFDRPVPGTILGNMPYYRHGHDRALYMVE